MNRNSVKFKAVPIFRKYILTVVFLAIGSAFAQHVTKVNIPLRLFLQSVDDNATVRLVVKGQPSAVFELTSKFQGTCRKAVDNYCVVSIKASYVEKFAADPAVERIEFSGFYKGYLLNDSMLVNNKISPVHNGMEPLTSRYDGTGTIIGFIDTGIDFTHPDFRDSLGNTRILSIWDQSVDTLVASRIPRPYGYGQVWDSLDINSGSCPHDDDILSHGSNVAGVAAGNGLAVDMYKGAAPGADLVMVASDFNSPDWLNTVADGVEYIFKLADSLERPCVVNISAGSYLGSHDGSDPAALRIDSLVKAKKGRFLSCAAGNLGTLPFHLGYNVNSDTNFTWFRYNSSINGVFFELWADTADFRQVHFAFGADKVTPSFDFRGRTTFDQVTNRLNTIYRDSIVNASNVLTYIDTYAELVGDKYLFQAYFPAPDSSQYYFRFMTTGTGKFDVWSDQVFGISSMVSSGIPSIATFPDIAHYKRPDTLKTLVSSFACLESVATVANYVNRDRYKDVDSILRLDINLIGMDITPGEIAASSCLGPTRNGLLKPDVAATGDFIITTNRLASIPLHIANGQSDRIGIGGMHKRNGGTSMAAPVVAGIAALYFEKCPKATYQEVLSAINSTAFSDTFATNLPNPKWGNGKVDGLAALSVSVVKPVVLPSILNDICLGEKLELSGENGYVSYNWINGDSVQSFMTDTTAIYQLYVTDSSGCTGISDSVFVNVHNLPAIPDINLNEFTLYTTLSANNYQWYLNGFPVSGATDSLWVAKKNGTYFVEVTNAYGCSTFSDTIGIDITTSVFKNLKNMELMEIYPNPSTGVFKLKVPWTNVNHNNVRIIDLLGKQLEFTINKIDNKVSEITVQNYSTSTYFVQVYDGNEWISSRVAFQSP